MYYDNVYDNIDLFRHVITEETIIFISHEYLKYIINTCRLRYISIFHYTYTFIQGLNSFKDVTDIIMIFTSS